MPEDQGFQAWLEGLVDSGGGGNHNNTNAYEGEALPTASSFVAYGGKDAASTAVRAHVSSFSSGARGAKGVAAGTAAGSSLSGLDARAGGEEDGLRGTVTTLLKQWHDHVATLPSTTKGIGLRAGSSSSSSSSSSLSSLSSAEVRFFQRVADLVQMSHEKMGQAEERSRQSARSCEKAESASLIARDRLKVCIEHLHRYRRRAHALEGLVNNNSRYTEVQQSTLVSLLRRYLCNERASHLSTSLHLHSERRERKLAEIRITLEQRQHREMQVRVAELEARGSATIRGRDEAVAALEGRIRVSEADLRKWFLSELPRLVSGLPLTEDAG